MRHSARALGLPPLTIAEDTVMADTKQPELGFRTAKGEWRPPYAIKFVPLFCWPLRPMAALKWLFGGGYLWPWDLFFMLTRHRHMALAPAAPVPLCGISCGLDLPDLPHQSHPALAGGGRLALVVLHLQGARACSASITRIGRSVNDRNFLFRNQLYDNIFWSCVSGCTVWTAYEVLYFWAAANHHVPYVSWTEHPVYCTVLAAA